MELLNLNFVVSCNDDYTYSSFVGMVTNYYKKCGHNLSTVWIGQPKNSDTHTEPLNYVHPSALVDYKIQGKLARIYYIYSRNDYNLYTILDIDQFLLGFDNFINLTARDRQFLKDGLCDVIALGSNGYNIESMPLLKGKWSMSYTTTTPQGIRNTLGLPSGLSFAEFCESYLDIQDPIDGKESTANTPEIFSDESLLRWCALKSNARIKHVDMPGFSELINTNRIDRNSEVLRMSTSNLFGKNFWSQKELTTNQELAVLNGRFFDMCPPRPMNNPVLIRKVLDFSYARWQTIKPML